MRTMLGETIIAVLFCLLSLPSGGQTAVSGINCYTDVEMLVQEDCGMHTGCIKKFDTKTQQTLLRGCFLTPGVNDTCGTDDKGVGYCYCHTDLCNAAAKTATTTSVLAAVAMAITATLLGYGSLN